MTKKILFDYEKIRILCERTNQLALGAKPLIKNINGLTVYEIAKIELEKKIIPIKILRNLPNNKKEIISLDELIF